MSLHDKYAAHGLSVLAFPCNQFGGQEPGSAAEIKAFVEAHGVAHSDTFRLMTKVWPCPRIVPKAGCLSCVQTPPWARLLACC